jgi:hypothetical protein
VCFSSAGVQIAARQSNACAVRAELLFRITVGQPVFERFEFTDSIYNPVIARESVAVEARSDCSSCSVESPKPSELAGTHLED